MVLPVVSLLFVLSNEVSSRRKLTVSGNETITPIQYLQSIKESNYNLYSFDTLAFAYKIIQTNSTRVNKDVLFMNSRAEDYEGSFNVI